MLPRELLRILNFYADPAVLKDGLNFDDSHLKFVFCKLCKLLQLNPGVLGENLATQLL